MKGGGGGGVHMFFSASMSLFALQFVFNSFLYSGGGILANLHGYIMGQIKELIKFWCL